MGWQLMHYAKKAEETANGLLGFEDEIPQYRKDIRSHMAELYAISHALHELHDALRPTDYGRYAGYIAKDIEVCLPSLGHTLDEIQGIFGKSKKSLHTTPGAFPGTPPYAIIWEDALEDFKSQGMPLPQRFETIRMYLQGMLDALKGMNNDAELAKYKVLLSKLLRKQQPVGSYFSELPVEGGGKGSARTPKPSSPKVPRPKIRSHPTYPAPQHLGYQTSSPPLPYRAHIAPTWGGIGDVPYVPPPVPEIPQSPTYSSASSQAFSNQSTDSETVAHWAMKIFDGRYTSTPFQTLGEPSECFGRDEPRVLKMLEEDGFEIVLELSFEATNVWVRMYWRAEDNRARILVLAMEPDGRRVRYQIPITALALRRNGSCLQLCRANRRDGRLDLWARLRFPMYERMVLFYCTAIAMKRQDQTTVAEELVDMFGSEELLFGGETTDNGSLHAFRIFYDRDSGCVRFEATARRGPMNTTPIWTAFVTQYYRQDDWIKRVAPDTIQFAKLHPYMFCDSYRLPKGPTGKYRLKFSTPEDAKQFRECFTR